MPKIQTMNFLRQFYPPLAVLFQALAYVCFLLGATLLPISAVAQTVFAQQFQVPVTNISDQQMRFAWTGGLNNPQFSQADLNADGIADLYVFDRGSNKSLIFTHNGTLNSTHYQFNTQIARHFPTMNNWALLRRFECDDNLYLFTSEGGDGVRVYRSSGYDNGVVFELLIDKLTYPDGAETKNLFVSQYDIPDITDSDGDGDLDLFTFGPAGGHVQWFRNTAAESGNPCGTPQYVLEEACWGDFYESGISTSLGLQQPCRIQSTHSDVNTDIGFDLAIDTDAGGELPMHRANARHPGSTLMVEDLDGDGDKDITLGDISFTNLVTAFNGGTPNDASMNAQDTLFPSYDVPAIIDAFPAAFAVDADLDGRRDMIVSPNARVQSQHLRCAWYYHNTADIGTNFVYQTDTFLMNDMIDLNRQSNPAFFDHNGDGLLDLLVGNYGYMGADGNFTSQLVLYENIGTQNSPAFQLVSNNYMNVQGQFALQRLALAPAFGDLDGDGDQDLLLGDSEGFFHYFNNQPNNGIANFVLQGEQYQGLDILKFTTPQLVDVDGDGLIDLLTGHHNGEINYRRNTGTTNTPVFTTLASSFFGQIDVQQSGSTTGYSAPQLVTMPNGERLLFVGSESGLIRVFGNINGNIGGAFTELTTAQSGIENNAGQSLYAGEYSKPAIADLDNDNRLDLIVGLYQGGLVWYEQDFSVGLSTIPTMATKHTLQVYPTPTNDVLWVTMPPNHAILSKASLVLTDMSGKIVLQKQVQVNDDKMRLDLSNLNAGIYLVRLIAGEGVWSARVMLVPSGY